MYLLFFVWIISEIASSSSSSPSQLYYKGIDNQVFGPFSDLQIKQWYYDGYFSDNTLISVDEYDFFPISSIIHSQNFNSESESEWNQNSDNSMSNSEMEYNSFNNEEFSNYGVEDEDVYVNNYQSQQVKWSFSPFKKIVSQLKGKLKQIQTGSLKTFNSKKGKSDSQRQNSKVMMDREKRQFNDDNNIDDCVQPNLANKTISKNVTSSIKVSNINSKQSSTYLNNEYKPNEREDIKLADSKGNKHSSKLSDSNFKLSLNKLAKDDVSLWNDYIERDISEKLSSRFQLSIISVSSISKSFTRGHSILLSFFKLFFPQILLSTATLLPTLFFQSTLEIVFLSLFSAVSIFIKVATISTILYSSLSGDALTYFHNNNFIEYSFDKINNIIEFGYELMSNIPFISDLFDSSPNLGDTIYSNRHYAGILIVSISVLFSVIVLDYLIIEPLANRISYNYNKNSVSSTSSLVGVDTVMPTFGIVRNLLMSSTISMFIMKSLSNSYGLFFAATYFILSSFIWMGLQNRSVVDTVDESNDDNSIKVWDEK